MLLKAFVRVVLVALLAPVSLTGADFVEVTSVPFGSFGGVDFVHHSGRFEGATSLGAYRVPFEIIAPADPSLGNRTVLFEPPHFGFGPVAREFTMGRDFVFGRGYSYAAAGFGTNGLNILNPTATARYRVIDTVAGKEIFKNETTVNIGNLRDDEFQIPALDMGADSARIEHDLLVSQSRKMGKELYGYYEEW